MLSLGTASAMWLDSSVDPWWLLISGAAKSINGAMKGTSEYKLWVRVKGMQSIILGWNPRHPHTTVALQIMNIVIC